MARVRCAAALAAVVLCGCVAAATAPPVQEMSDARQALAAARANAADHYSAAEYQRALALLSQAEASLQRGAFAVAKRFAIDARFAAIRARESAVARSRTPVPVLPADG